MRQLSIGPILVPAGASLADQTVVVVQATHAITIIGLYNSLSAAIQYDAFAHRLLNVTLQLHKNVPLV